MRPPPRGMVMETEAVLDESVPVLLSPVALTAAPFAGFTVTVICEFSGMFEQCTLTGIGLFCCAERTASGVDSRPVGEGDTGIPAILVTVNCGS